jgi:hypothetical protein
MSAGPLTAYSPLPSRYSATTRAPASSSTCAFASISASMASGVRAFAAISVAFPWMSLTIATGAAAANVAATKASSPNRLDIAP